ncbi:MAG: polysaccharide biosynthesis protein [Peptostreptococcaceae bacterium]
MEMKLTEPSEKRSAVSEILDNYRVRQAVLVAVDVCIVLIGFLLSSQLTSVETVQLTEISYELGVYTACILVAFGTFRCYSSLWRYAGVEEVLSICVGGIVSMPVVMILHSMIGKQYPLLFYVVNTIFIIALASGFRVSYRVVRRLKREVTSKESVSKVLIIGAGQAGEMVIGEIKRNPQINKEVVGIIDDDTNKIGRRIHGIKILGTTDELDKIVERENVDEIILAMAKVSKKRKREIIELCNDRCKLKTVPGIFEIIDGKVDIKNIRDVEIEDLLGREPIKTNLSEISDYLEDKVVMVTGGGGSIGSELCRQIAGFRPKELIIIDNYENNAYAI